MEEKQKFPDGFLWGAATSSYQVEGGIENNDWAAFARKSKLPTAGMACEQWNRFAVDFDLARSLGHNAHRFSIEWARIEPAEGQFDQAAIEHYRQVLLALRERGLEPLVTLWHFTLPVWFSAKGGFVHPRAPEIFARYCEHVVRELGELAKFWITINEPLVYSSNSYRVGVWPPFQKNIFTFWKIIGQLITAHKLAYEKIKPVQPDVQVGIAKNLIYFEKNNVLYYPLVSFLDWFWNRRFLAGISGRQDFMGVNYYFHRRFPKNKNESVSDMGWEIFPEGIYHVVKSLKKYNLPIYITENGLADAADSRRAKFIKDHLCWIWQAIQEGIDVRGYLHWSLLDNFEWHHGYGPRFGLVAVDFATQTRTIRPSAYEYKKICETNTL